MRNTTNTRFSGFSRQALRTWAMLFLAAGIAGKSIVQNGMLGLSGMSGGQLLEAMQGDSAVMGLATLALVLEAMEACAVPIFAFLLVEGFQKTSSLKMYALRVCGVALLAEIPYNLAVSGKLLAMDSRNPAFAMALCMALMYFFMRYSEKKASHVLIKALVLVSAILWTEILGIDHGFCCVILTAVLWATWKKQNIRTFAGCSAVMCCCLASPYYLVSPMAFLAIHFYNGEKGEENRLVNYLCYPVILLVLGLVSLLLF